MVGLGPTMAELDTLRETAVNHGVDPLSLEPLRDKPNQLVALLCDGLRVEPAFYHRENIVNDDGFLSVEGISPVTGARVTGFKTAPALTDLDEFIHFLDWNGDGWLSVTEVATAFASLLPVDQEGVEQFVRDNFNVDQGGLIGEEELKEQILPFCGERLWEIIRAAPIIEPPQITRKSARSELLAWFNHVDINRSGDVELSDIRFAIASTMYKGLGDSVDIETKETVTQFFLAEADLCGEGKLSKEEFLDLVSPSFKANLPEHGPRQPHDADAAAGGVTTDRSRGQSVAKRGSRSTEADGTPVLLNDQKPSTTQKLDFRVFAPLSGETLVLNVTTDQTIGDIKRQVTQKWQDMAPIMLWLCGQSLDDDSQNTAAFPQLRRGCVITALPGAAKHSKCIIS